MDETTSEMLTIQDLAARWGVSVAKAKSHVRRNHVPFFQIGTLGDRLINWGTARFLLADIRQWEKDATRVFEEPEPAKAAKPGVSSKYKFTKMR